MSIAVDVELVVAGFVNRHSDKEQFTVDDVWHNYITSLWNAGCGPVRLNFTKDELELYLDKCVGVCLDKTLRGYRINKSLLSSQMTEKEADFLDNDPNLAKSFDLFCRLQVDFRTPSMMLDFMGFRFIYAHP